MKKSEIKTIGKESYCRGVLDGVNFVKHAFEVLKNNNITRPFTIKAILEIIDDVEKILKEDEK